MDVSCRVKSTSTFSPPLITTNDESLRCSEYEHLIQYLPGHKFSMVYGVVLLIHESLRYIKEPSGSDETDDGEDEGAGDAQDEGEGETGDDGESDEGEGSGDGEDGDDSESDGEGEGSEDDDSSDDAADEGEEEGDDESDSEDGSTDEDAD